MTREVGDLVVIERENPQQCDLCGAIAELRPYGPGGACVCFQCAMKDERGTEARFRAILDGEERKP